MLLELLQIVVQYYLLFICFLIKYAKVSVKTKQEVNKIIRVNNFIL